MRKLMIYGLMVLCFLFPVGPVSAQLTSRSGPEAPPPPQWRYFVVFEKPAAKWTPDDVARVEAITRWCESMSNAAGKRGRMIGFNDDIVRYGVLRAVNACSFEGGPLPGQGSAWPKPPPPGVMSPTPELCPAELDQYRCYMVIRDRR